MEEKNYCTFRFYKHAPKYCLRVIEFTTNKPFRYLFKYLFDFKYHYSLFIKFDRAMPLLQKGFSKSKTNSNII